MKNYGIYCKCFIRRETPELARAVETQCLRLPVLNRVKNVAQSETI